MTFCNVRPNLLVPFEGKINPLLRKLLQQTTPHGEEFRIKQIIINLPFVQNKKWQYLDDNLLITVGNSSTVFSCHMDTVSEVTAKNKAENKVDFIELLTPVSNAPGQKGFIYGAKILENSKEIKYLPSTLGADDKVGVFILLKMIEQNIPGLYLFHVGEEKGGIGSAALAKRKDIFTSIKRAIAFDRANYTDIICFQRGSRCCSTEFANALAEKLNTNLPVFNQYAGDVHGTFTDTANYMNFIPECTNLSVGYFCQHGNDETLDTVFLEKILLPAVLSVSTFDDLPVYRNPKAKTESTYFSYYFQNNKTNTNSTIVNWATATKTTPYIDLPLWEPEDGYIEEACPEVLVKCIANYFKKTTNPAELDKVAEFYFNLLEDRADLLVEVAELEAEINNLRGPDDRNDPQDEAGPS